MFLLGERLRSLREEFDYDQKDLGKKLHISTSAYGYYEQNRNEPSLETLVKIAQIYNVSTDYLLGLSKVREQQEDYTTLQRLPLNRNELKAIERMKETSLLKNVSEDPVRRVDQLTRYWNFLQTELNNSEEND